MKKLEHWINPMDEYKNAHQKSAAISAAKQNKECAIDINGNKYPLESCATKKLAFIAGIWRIQSDFPYEITHVRDRDFVLIEKIPHTESTNFEYWVGKLVGYNCYGPFITSGKIGDFIVAKYDTDDGPRWGYGTTIEAARAFLGLKLWDEYKDVFHRIACKNKLKTK